VKFKLRKKYVYSLRERLHEAEVLTVLSAFLPETPDNLKPVAEKLAFDKVIQELGPIAAQMLEKGDEERFLYAVASCGPKLLAEPPVMERLHWQWLLACYQEHPKGKRAKQFLKHLGQALSWGPRGHPLKSSETERAERKRSNDLAIKQDHRALRYAAQLGNMFTQQTSGVNDTNTLQEKALDIARKGLSRGGVAKQEGVRLFLDQVRHDLLERTVSSK